MSATPHDTTWRDALAASLTAASVFHRDEPMARRTTLRVGGPADAYVEPASIEDLATVVRFCAQRALPWFVLGRGSNLLVRDGGFRGVVLSLAQPVFSRIEARDARITCGAGARLKAVAAEAKRLSLAGLEFLEGIPGTVGGALRMNAGAMGSWTFDVVQSVTAIDASGEVRTLPVSQIAIEYRSCPMLKNHIAVEAILAGRADEKKLIEQRMESYNRKRWTTQPAAPSAGCMFKNPPTVPAGKLIDELGLKGSRVGGALVSLEHGNFIVNDGTATAADVLRLIDQIRARARAERGIELATEVEIIGE